MTEERRKRTLTDADIEAITEVLTAKQHICVLGLTYKDGLVIKSHLRWWNRGVTIVGTIILTSVTLFAVALFTKGFWFQVADAVKGIKIYMAFLIPTILTLSAGYSFWFLLW
jgi:hypothetical protein